MWAGTLDYFLGLEHSKKNIEEYFWIQQHHNARWYRDELAPSIINQCVWINIKKMMNSTHAHQEYVPDSLIFM
jgi:hypothetical protein